MESIGRWIATMPAGTVLQTSSTGVYPQGDGARVDESSPIETGEGRGGLLRLAETTLESMAVAAGWRWFVLRLAGIYGPGRHHLLDQIRKGGALSGDPATRLNLVHRDDICSAIFACLGSGGVVPSGVFNLTDGSPHTRGEVAAWIAKRIGISEPGFGGTNAPGPSGRRVTPDRVIDPSRFRAAFKWSPKHADFRSGFAEILPED
jgi:nucleoside-diphosphate-sugar epimerase